MELYVSGDSARASVAILLAAELVGLKKPGKSNEVCLHRASLRDPLLRHPMQRSPSSITLPQKLLPQRRGLQRSLF